MRDSVRRQREGRAQPLGGGRIRSEWVADFRRNGWPDCLGISGRFGSDYAVTACDSRPPVPLPVCSERSFSAWDQRKQAPREGASSPHQPNRLAGCGLPLALQSKA